MVFRGVLSLVVATFYFFSIATNIHDNSYDLKVKIIFTDIYKYYTAGFVDASKNEIENMFYSLSNSAGDVLALKSYIHDESVYFTVKASVANDISSVLESGLKDIFSQYDYVEDVSVEIVHKLYDKESLTQQGLYSSILMFIFIFFLMPLRSKEL